jgi:MFS family permease
LISNALPAHQQGTAGSLVNTIVNYSIAFGLGLAGTVEQQVNRNGTDIERGYRGALYLGVGIAGLGIACALLHLLLDVFSPESKPSEQKSSIEESSSSSVEEETDHVEKR